MDVIHGNIEDFIRHCVKIHPGTEISYKYSHDFYEASETVLKPALDNMMKSSRAILNRESLSASPADENYTTTVPEADSKVDEADVTREIEQVVKDDQRTDSKALSIVKEKDRPMDEDHREGVVLAAERKQ